MTEQMPGPAVVVLVVVLAGWTLVASMRTEERVLTWWVARSAGRTLRTICVTAGLHIGISLWCLFALGATLAWVEPARAGTWGAGLLALGAVATVSPLVAHFLPTQTDLGPARADLVAAGASTRAARAIRWTSFPFAVAETAALIAAPMVALLAP